MFSHSVYDSIRVRVIVVRDDQLLMNAPGAPDQKGRVYRCLPGGGLEPDESLFACGEREVREETGLRVRATSVAFLREWIVPKHVPLEQARDEVRSWGYPEEYLHGSDHAYLLEVFLWAELLGDHGTAIVPKDGIGPTAEWIPLERIEQEPLFPPELRALAADLAAGRPCARVPSFIARLGTPWDQPARGAFRDL